MQTHTYSPGEIAAARLFVHRILCEYTDTDFDEEALGMKAVAPDSMAVFVTDDGVTADLGDIMYAALSIIMPLIGTLTAMDPDGSDPLDWVEAIGIGVASQAED